VFAQSLRIQDDVRRRELADQMLKAGEGTETPEATTIISMRNDALREMATLVDPPRKADEN